MPSLAAADALFVEEDYHGALAEYTQLLAVTSDLRALVHRSIVHVKLGRFAEAIADADAAIAMDGGCSPALLRKGVAHFQLDEFARAETALARAAELDPTRATKMWLRKARAELGAGGGTAAPAPAPPIAAPSTQRNAVPANASSTTCYLPTAGPSALKNVRHEWYQTDSHVVLALFFKKMRKEDCELTFTARECDISLKLPGSGSDFMATLELFGEIVPSGSQYEVLPTKIEIRLQKADGGVKWAALTDESSHSEDAGGGDAAPAYPSSNQKKIDWDQVDRDATAELEGEKLEGDQALNKLFKDIYGRADEETRRAMNKSFQTSGGTVLSTNWGEVSTKDYEKDQVAPKGMEWKDYEPKK